MIQDDAHGSTAPLVSVVLPVRDGARHLATALASVRAQTFVDWELVVVDDGSTDATPDVLAAAAASDGRIRIERQDATGLVAALQRGVAEARGAYVARMDADDWSAPDRFERQVALLDAHPDVVLVGGSFDVVDPGGRVLRTEPGLLFAADVGRELFVRNPFAHGSVMVRKAALLAAGGYADDHPAAEDYDLWRRLSQLGALTNVPAVVYRWRANPEGVTLSQPERQARSTAAVRDGLWSRSRPGVLDRRTLRERAAAHARVTDLGPLLVDRFQEVQLALVIELARRGHRRDALAQLVAFAGHRASAPVALLVYALSGGRFTSARRVVGAVGLRARAPRPR